MPSGKRGYRSPNYSLGKRHFDLIFCLTFSHAAFDKLRTVVASNVFRSSVFNNQYPLNA
jgi:hypothetical protein